MAPVAPDAPHRAIACFHGLLSVLLAPLARFVAQHCGESESALSTSGFNRAGVYMQLLLIRENWYRVFRQHAPHTMLEDVKVLLGVQNLTHYRAVVSEKSVARAFPVINRMLVAVGADDETMRQAHALSEILGMLEEVDEPAFGVNKAYMSADGSIVGTAKPDHKCREELMGEAMRLSAEANKEAIRESLQLLREALQLSQTTEERHKIHLLRSEVCLRADQRALAYEDAAEVLSATSLSKRKAMRLSTVFMALDRRNEAVAAFDLGLLRTPEDYALQDGKKKVLQNLESWEGSEDVCWENVITKSPLVRPSSSAMVDEDDWFATLDDGNGLDTLERQENAAQSHRLTPQDLDQWGAVPLPLSHFTPHRTQAAEITASQASNESEEAFCEGETESTGCGVVTEIELLNSPSLPKEDKFDCSLSASISNASPFSMSQKRKPRDALEELIEQANLCATSGDLQTIDQAIILLTEALRLASSKMQQAQVRCLRGECYRKIGQNELAHQDALLGSQVRSLRKDLAARLGFLLAATSGSSKRLDWYDRCTLPSKLRASACPDHAVGTIRATCALKDGEETSSCDLGNHEEHTYVSGADMIRQATASECEHGPDMSTTSDGPDDISRDHERHGDASSQSSPVRKQRLLISSVSRANGGQSEQPLVSGVQSRELRKAMQRVASRSFASAIHWISQEIARVKPEQVNDAALYVLRASCRFELKQYKNVLKDAQEALVLDPLNADGHYWGSVALQHLGRINEARVMCEDGLRIDPYHTRLHLHRKHVASPHDPLELRSAKPPTTTMQVRLPEAGNHSLIGLYPSEGTNIGAARKIVRRGESYLAMGDHTRALEDAGQALSSMQYKYGEASSLRTRTLIAMGRHMEALETCVLALMVSPNAPFFVRHCKDLMSQIIKTTTGTAASVTRKKLVQEGHIHARSGNISAASHSFTEALEYAGSHKSAAKIFSYRAKCFLGLKEYGLASQDACVGLLVPSMKLTASKTFSEALLANGNVDAASIVCSAALNAPLLQIQKQIEFRSGKQHSKELDYVVEVHDQPKRKLKKWTAKLQELLGEAASLTAACNYKGADGIYDEALSLLDSDEVASNASALKSRKIGVFGHKARGAHAAKDFVKSIDVARCGLALCPGWAEGHRIVCRALIALDRWSEALTACESVLSLAPDDVAFRTLREQTKSAIAQAVTKPGKAIIEEKTEEPAHKISWLIHARELLRTGLVLLGEKKLAEAETRFTDGMVFLSRPRVAPDAGADELRIDLLGHRARCRIASREYDSAAKDAQEVITQRPEWIEGHRLLCHALIGKGAWRQALDACDQILARTPQDVDFVRLKDELLSKTGGSLADQDGQLEIKPDSFVSKTFKQLSTQAGLLVSNGEHIAAIVSSSKAINLLESNDMKDISPMWKAGVYVNRARCHAKSSAFDLMLEDARAGIRHSPQWVEGYRLECVALMKLGRWLEAKIACTSVLAQLPKDPTFLCHLAQISKRLQFEDQVPGEPPNTDTTSTPQQATLLMNADGMPVASSAITGSSSADQESNDKSVVSRFSDMDESRVVAFASEGSVIAQRYLAAQRFLSSAEAYLADGALMKTFQSVRDALVLWPRLDFSHTSLNDLLLIGQVDAIAWGGPMLFFFMQAKKTSFGSVVAEEEFWAKCVSRYPHDPDLHAKFADVAYRTGDVKRSLMHMNKAIELRATVAGAVSPVPVGWWYLRARCLPSKTDSPTHWIQSLLSKSQQQAQTREDEYLNFVQRACVDDEWMAHACYSLGVFYLAKNDLARAKQFHFLAETAESRRGQLDLFPAIDDEVFGDKKTLNEAFHGSVMVLYAVDQQRAITIVEHESEFWRCGVCGAVSTRVDEYANHKAAGCLQQLPGHT